jgi:membrane associated rhomboid family serine protease
MLLVPFRTDRPRQRPAYLTALLIAVNVVAYGVWTAYGMWGPADVAAGPYPPQITSFGLWSEHLSPLSFVTHLFIHTDPLHLLGNMLFLWIFGSLIEDAIRPWGLAALYIGGGILAAAAHLALAAQLGVGPEIPLVGASGSVAAIMGLFMIRFFRTRVQLFCCLGWARRTFWVQSTWALLYWIGLEAVGGAVSVFAAGGDGIAHWAHLGGFAAGAAAAPFLGSFAAARREYVCDDPLVNLRALRQAERIAEAERSLRTSPRDLRLLRWLADAYRMSGDDARAAEMHRRCLDIYVDRREVEPAALAYLELARDGAPPSLAPELLFEIAEALEGREPPEAAAIYRLLATRHPTRPEAEQSLGRLARLCRERLERPEEAARCLDELARRYPHSPARGNAG